MAELPEKRDLRWQEEVYVAKAAELLLYGRALGLSQGEAEDVLQDTFVSLLRLEGRPAKPDAYAVRVMRNKALNYRRGFWRRLRREFESRCWFEAGDDDEPSAARMEAARLALMDLPQEQREVIVLKVWHGYTFEAIGGILEISANTAAGRYRYGLQKLKRQLLEVEHESVGSIGEGVGDGVVFMAAARAARAD